MGAGHRTWRHACACHHAAVFVASRTPSVSLAPVGRGAPQKRLQDLLGVLNEAVSEATDSAVRVCLCGIARGFGRGRAHGRPAVLTRALRSWWVVRE